MAEFYPGEAAVVPAALDGFAGWYWSRRNRSFAPKPVGTMSNYVLSPTATPARP